MGTAPLKQTGLDIVMHVGSTRRGERVISVAVRSQIIIHLGSAQPVATGSLTDRSGVSERGLMSRRANAGYLDVESRSI